MRGCKHGRVGFVDTRLDVASKVDAYRKLASQEKAKKKYVELEEPEFRYCTHCEAFKPERTHHCRECKRCVLMMDHHWFGGGKIFLSLNLTCGFFQSLGKQLCWRQQSEGFRALPVLRDAVAILCDGLVGCSDRGLGDGRHGQSWQSAAHVPDYSCGAGFCVPAAGDNSCGWTFVVSDQLHHRESDDD